MPSAAVLRASRPVSMHVPGVLEERVVQRTDVPQVPQESNTLRQSGVLVEPPERAGQLRRDLPCPRSALPVPSPREPVASYAVPCGAVAKISRVELAVLWMHLPDDVLVPDGLGDVLTARGVRQNVQ